MASILETNKFHHSVEEMAGTVAVFLSSDGEAMRNDKSLWAWFFTLHKKFTSSRYFSSFVIIQPTF